ncbi:MAG: glycosyltransferase [Gemmatimonadota bacterium]
MKRLVLVAYHVPPQIGIASERAASLLRWLPRLGWSVSLVTPHVPFFPIEGASSGSPVEGVERIGVASPELGRWLHRRRAVPADAPQPGPQGAATSWARRFVREWVYVPDSRVAWIPFAARAVRSLLAAADPQHTVVLSTSVPYSAHFAAMIGIRGGRFPWVAEFRDPWSEAHPFLRPRSAGRRLIDDRLHRMVLARANRVVVTSQSTLEGLRRSYGVAEGRIAVVQNGYEPTPPGTPPGPHEPCVFLYGGSVAPGERVEPLLEGLAAAQRCVDVPLRLRVRGPREPWASACRALELPSSLVELPGSTSAHEARAEMAHASANLLVNAHPAYAAVLPGKAFEYLGVRRPIVAALRPGSELEVLLTDYARPLLVDGASGSAWSTAFVEVARRHRAGTLQTPVDERRPLAALSREWQMGSLATLLDEVLAGP